VWSYGEEIFERLFADVIGCWKSYTEIFGWISFGGLVVGSTPVTRLICSTLMFSPMKLVATFSSFHLRAGAPPVFVALFVPRLRNPFCPGTPAQVEFPRIVEGSPSYVSSPRILPRILTSALPRNVGCGARPVVPLSISPPPYKVSAIHVSFLLHIVAFFPDPRAPGPPHQALIVSGRCGLLCF